MHVNEFSPTYGDLMILLHKVDVDAKVDVARLKRAAEFVNNSSIINAAKRSAIKAKELWQMAGSGRKASEGVMYSNALLDALQ